MHAALYPFFTGGPPVQTGEKTRFLREFESLSEHIVDRIPPTQRPYCRHCSAGALSPEVGRQPAGTEAEEDGPGVRRPREEDPRVPRPAGLNSPGRASIISLLSAYYPFIIRSSEQ